MEKRHPDGFTERHHLEAAEAQGMHVPQLYPIFKGPEQALYLLNLFNEISNGRGSTGFGLTPLTYLDFGMWTLNTGCRLTSTEREFVKLIDSVFLDVMTPPPPPTTPTTGS